MKRILIINSILLVFAVSFSACEKIEKDTPPAIKKIIRECKRDFGGGQVLEYEYNQSNAYYCIPDNCNDCFSICYDKKGIELWRDGGIMGLMPPKDFEEKAVFKRIIWTSRSTKE